MRERESQIDREQNNIQIALLLQSVSIRLVQGRLKTFNYLHFFLILGLYLLSTLVSLVQLNFSLLLTTGPSGLLQVNTQTAWWLMSLLTAYTLLTAGGCKFPSLYIFQVPSHSFYAIHMAFLMSFVYLKTQVDILFWNPQSYTVCQRSIFNTIKRFYDSGLKKITNFKLNISTTEKS